MQIPFVLSVEGEIRFSRETDIHSEMIILLKSGRSKKLISTK